MGLSSMLAMRKPTKGPDGKADIRICKEMNGTIKPKHFPMRIIEEVATPLRGGRFSFRLTPAMDFGKLNLIKRPVY